MAIKDRVLSIKISSKLYDEYSTLADEEGTSLADYTRNSLEFKKQYNTIITKLHDEINEFKAIQKGLHDLIHKTTKARVEAYAQVKELKKVNEKLRIVVNKAMCVLDEKNKEKFAEVFKKELASSNGELGPA